MRLLFAALALLLTAAPSFAQTPDRYAQFKVLGLAPSARATALQGSVGAMYGDDPVAHFYNPALLNRQMDRQVAVSYLNHLADISAGSALYVRDIERLQGTLAASFRYLSYGEFERADQNGVRDGSTFGAGDVALSVSYARALTADERLRGGATIHALFATLDDANASALAFDAGVAYTIPEQRLTVSAAIVNAGTVFSSFGEEDDTLPFDLRLAVAKRLANVPLQLTVTGYDLADLTEGAGNAANRVLNHVTVGGELYFGSAFMLRAGYNDRLRDELNPQGRFDIAGVGLGFGLNIRRVGFDYGYSGWSEVGGLHQFSLRTRL
ncbi:MAG: type IX secretion system protein PorQ [Bacteroidota bacterium]